jgi:hypothetical protein
MRGCQPGFDSCADEYGELDLAQDRFERVEPTMEAGLHGHRIVALQVVEQAAGDEAVQVRVADLNLMHSKTAPPAVPPTRGPRCTRPDTARR